MPWYLLSIVRCNRVNCVDVTVKSQVSLPFSRQISSDLSNDT